MSKSFKLNNDVYLDSLSISHNKESLKEFLNKGIFKNLFNINNLTFNNSNVECDYENNKFIVHQYGNQSQQSLQQLCPMLEVGKTYTMTLETTSSSKYIFLNGSSSIWKIGTSRVITQAELDGTVNFYGNWYEDSSTVQTQTISNIQIEESSEKSSVATPYANYIKNHLNIYKLNISLQSGQSYQNDLLKNAKFVVVNWMPSDGSWSMQTFHVQNGYSLNTYSSWSVGSIYNPTDGTIKYQYSTDTSMRIYTIMIIK